MKVKNKIIICLLIVLMLSILNITVYAAASFANVAFISGDAMVEQIHLVMQQMGSMMDSNSKALMDSYMEKLPQITFFSNLIYCFVYGTVLSRIITRLISGQTRSSGYKPEEQ